VTCMVNSSQSMVAQYRYDPFGRTIYSSGSLATANVYRFSSKEIHGNSGMYYYGFRFYDPMVQRWLNQDPIQEYGGLNLYAFVFNDPVDSSDRFGLAIVFVPPGWQGPPEEGDIIVPCPEAPPGVSVRENIKESAKHFDPRWFRDQVKKGGPWDYKQQGRQYEPFGNFNYGATGIANGYPFDEEFLLRMAGAAQIKDGTSKPGWGDPAMSWLGLPYRSRGTPPYGDDPEDQKWIKFGVEYYKQYQSGDGPCH
jgi:type VI secretion system secreted protein VgrG